MLPDPDQDPAVTYTAEAAGGSLRPVNAAALAAWAEMTAGGFVVASLLDTGISAGAADPGIQSSASSGGAGGSA